MADRYVGGCSCGAVEFEYVAPSKWCAYCHCSMCRRAHGAPFVAWVGVPREQFSWTRGEEHVRRHASSPGATRSFCGTCGSMLTFESTRWAGEVHIARAQIPGDIDRTPQAHCFYSDRVPWISIDDDLRKLGGVTGTEPLD